ncbi:CRAL_TRIO_N domain-containing protein [Nephila pilipes]|uniref:CRAL_TRIO_N domain-containing protein n=1 Tax=Nephila pilipes TaxID=299642 RepID=A0A8X6QFZ8_NEPPI|nr:CRAL_TRIO_N domain-containing protein [Nephila pilipes]
MNYLSTWQEGLTPEIKRKAEEELGETPEIKIQSLKELRRLIKEEAEFQPVKDDAFLIRFLRVKKYDVKKAFNCLRNYYVYKARYSRLLTDFKPSELLHVFKMNNLLYLPYRHPSGTEVAYMRPACYNIDEVTLEEIFAVGLLELEYSLQFEASQVCGYILIFDLDKINLRIMKYYASPKIIFRFVRLIQGYLRTLVKALLKYLLTLGRVTRKKKHLLVKQTKDSTGIRIKLCIQKPLMLLEFCYIYTRELSAFEMMERKYYFGNNLLILENLTPSVRQCADRWML